MKRFLLYFLITFSFGASTFAQNRFTIHMRTPLEAKGAKLYVNIMDNDKRTILKRDSLVIGNPLVEFSGILFQPSSFVNFYFKSKKLFISTLVVDTGNNDFVLTALPKLGTPNSSFTISAMHSKSNRIYHGLDSIQTIYYDRNGKIEASGITTLDKKAMLAMNLERVNYLKQYPNDFISLINLYEIGNYHRGSAYTNTVLNVFKTFDSSLQNSAFGKKFLEEKLEYLRNLSSAKLGGPVPEFTVSDLSGKIFDNTSLRGQNYMIIFSATWCVPCQKSLPEIKALYEKYKAKGLKVVYFNLDNDVVAWRKHVDKNKLTWINVSERRKWSDSKISRKFNVYAVPSYFIIDKTSKIILNSVDSGSDVSDLRKGLEQLYNETK